MVSRAPVERVEASECHALRRAVLRDGDAAAVVDWPEDAAPGAFHIGVRKEATLIAVASFAPVATPLRPEARAWQLRGMAVEPAHQGRGHGATLLDAALWHLRAAGAEVLWANARDSALGFYVGHGMSVEGDGFVQPDTGLPHHVVVLDLLDDVP
jgi:GNAT superfamily N-acetyltransferase